MENNKFFRVGNGISKLEINPDLKIGEGGYGKIYALDKDKCAKVFYVKYPNKAKKDTKEVLKRLKNINYNSIAKIYDFLYDSKNLEFKGYTMERCYGEMLNPMSEDLAKRILNMNSTDAINHYLEFELLKYVLSYDHIMVSDDLSSNIIVGDNSFKVIDCDSYLYRPKKDDEVWKENNSTFSAFTTAIPIRAAIAAGLSKEEIERVRNKSKEIFFNEEASLDDRVEMLNKEKTLVKTLLK